jgi:hypothetical protein
MLEGTIVSGGMFAKGGDEFRGQEMSITGLLQAEKEILTEGLWGLSFHQQTNLDTGGDRHPIGMLEGLAEAHIATEDHGEERMGIEVSALQEP